MSQQVRDSGFVLTANSSIRFASTFQQPRIQDLAMGGAVLREGRHVDTELMNAN